MSFYNLRDALTEAGCAVCRLKRDAVDHFLDILLWENVNDIDVRHNIRQSRGFCHDHAWQIADKKAALGTAIIHQDVLKNLLRALKETEFRTIPALSLRRARTVNGSPVPSPATADLVARLDSQAECPACVQGEKMEAIYLDNLVEHLLADNGLLSAFSESDGLCLPHLRQALIRIRDEPTYKSLVTAQQAIWETLVAQLDETIRKSDYRFRDEAWGDESGAWLRSVVAVSGDRGRQMQK